MTLVGTRYDLSDPTSREAGLAAAVTAALAEQPPGQALG